MIRSFIIDTVCSETGICNLLPKIQEIQNSLGIELEGKNQIGWYYIEHTDNFHILRINFKDDYRDIPDTQELRTILFDSVAQEVSAEKLSLWARFKGVFK